MLDRDGPGRKSSAWRRYEPVEVWERRPGAATAPLGALLARLTGGHEPLGGRRLTGFAVGLGGVAALLGLDVGAGDGFAVAELTLVVFGYAPGPLAVSRSLADLPTLDVVAASLGLCALVYAPVDIAQLPSAMPAPPVRGPWPDSSSSSPAPGSPPGRRGANPPRSAHRRPKGDLERRRSAYLLESPVAQATPVITSAIRPAASTAWATVPRSVTP